jgi:aralkylamine N-acetyltransferase
MGNNYRYKKEIPDIEKYYPLYVETGWNKILKLSKMEVQKALEGSFFCICAYDGDKLIGFGRVNSDGVIYAGIYDVIVSPNYQHQGIGSNIVKKIVEYCRLHHIRSIYLFSADGKKGFYEKLGFEARPETMPGMKYIKKI